jgi:Transglycosylase-like domain
MHREIRRRPAASEHRRTSAAPYLIACLVATAMAVVIAGAVQVAPAEGETSPRYQRLWDGLSDRNHRWARRTSQCESGKDRNIHGGGGTYHGAFQFMLSTWRSSPKSPGGDPHRYSWKTQAVVAIYLKKRDGARQHWPNCG